MADELRDEIRKVGRRAIRAQDDAPTSTRVMFEAMADAVVDAVLAALIDACPEKHDAWVHSLPKACPSCGVGVELNVHLPELSCCFATLAAAHRSTEPAGH